MFLSKPNTDAKNQAKYHEAAQQFGGTIKPESYKRQLWVISKKIKEAEAKCGDLGGCNHGDDEDDAGTPLKAKGGRKRKAATEEDAGEELGGEKAAGKKGREGKKAKVVVRDEEAEGEVEG